MAFVTPPKFTDLDDAAQSQDQLVNVVGVLVDLLPPRKSGGTDYSVTFSIVDKSARSFKVRCFAKQVKNLPQVTSTGDVVALENYKFKTYNGSPLFLSNFASKWAVYKHKSIPDSVPEDITSVAWPVTSPGFTLMSDALTQYAIDICNTQDRTVFKSLEEQDFDPNAVISTFAPKDKFSLIENLSFDRDFADMVGVVVKMYTVGIDQITVYLSDYTENPLLFEYTADGAQPGETSIQPGDEFGYIAQKSAKDPWQGPLGRRTIALTVWQPHASYFIKEVKPGNIVKVSNVHIFKRDDFHNLEGKMHGDRKWDDKVNVMKVSAYDDENAKAVLKRKRDYERDTGHVFGGKDENSKKRKAPENESRNQRKKRIQKEKKALQRQAVHTENSEDRKQETTIEGSPEPDTPLVMAQNSNIRCSHTAAPLPLSTIISTDRLKYTTPEGHICTLPYRNVNSRAQVRVVDFFPSDLADFSIRRKISQYDALSDNEGSSSELPIDSDESDDSDSAISTKSTQSLAEQSASYKWEWRFALLLEDAGADSTQRIVAHVHDDDATALLSMRASNLRKGQNQGRESKALCALREKLFQLWGELEEQKTAAGMVGEEAHRGNGVDAGSDSVMEEEREEFVPGSVSTPEFTCCLKEFGVREDDGGEPVWTRRWRMWGVKIV